MMNQGERFHSIDIMKGIFVLLVLFVNDLFMPAKVQWIPETTIANSQGIAGWVLPGFLFMFGMTIPFAITKKIQENLSSYEIIRHIFARTIILLAVGVLMININRVNPELTGFSKDTWALLMFLAVFLVWTRYPEKENNFFTVTGLRILGLAIFIFLIFRFRSGSLENSGSLIAGWWEIPGLIGWGFLVSALTYLAFRNSISGTLMIWLAFLSLNILGKLKLLEFMIPLKPYIGVLSDGYVPVILLSGHLASLVLKKFSANEYRKILLILAIMSLGMIVSGFSLRKWILTEEVAGNSGIALICCGLTLLVFNLVYMVADIRKNFRWFVFLKPAGENAMTTYIAPNIIYHLIWLTGIPALFYQSSANNLINVSGSALWAILMVWLTTFLPRMNIRLKI